MQHAVPPVLRELADRHFKAIADRLPRERLSRFLLFIEAVRFVDYWSIAAHGGDDAKRLPMYQLDLMQWGWNRVVACLFESLEQPDSFPLMRSTRESQLVAHGLLQEMGKVSLLSRLADMASFGIADVSVDGDRIAVRMGTAANAQFADATESDLLAKAEERLWPQTEAASGWERLSTKELERRAHAVGAMWARADTPMRSWLRPDIEALMRPLIKPWDTGRGVMMAYDASPEVDRHFIAEAMDISTHWRSAAGIGPAAKLGKVTGADVTGVAAAIISLHAKHVRFALVAAREHRNIALAQALTIWGRKSELEDAVCQMTRLAPTTVAAALDVLAVDATQAQRMTTHATPLIPLLFDLGNGLILRPVSCLTRNPFAAIKTLHQWHDPRTENAFAADREEWMRSELYSMFRGRRYRCIQGSVKIRRGAAVVTDIDAVVLDATTGDVGVFQLKWQDYSTNDVRQLRSKAVNLANELDDWAVKVHAWIEDNGLQAFSQALRLRQTRSESVRNVFLFGLSRASIRTEGYGVRIGNENLALATWPQLQRVRMEIGPSANVLRDLHAALIAERSRTVKVTPIPVDIEIGGSTIQIADLWVRYDDE